MKIRRTRNTPKAKATDPDFVFVEVRGVGDAAPNSLTLKHKDWICWVNPQSPGNKAFVLRFSATNPLKDVHGDPLDDKAQIKVGKGAPSCWYQFKGGVKKGDRFEYLVSATTGGPSQPPGPEIVSGD